MSEAVIIAIFSTAALIIGAIAGAYGAVRRLPAEIKRVNVDTNHVAVNAANDALRLLKDAVAEQTKALTTAIDYLKQQVDAGKKQNDIDTETIISLNQLLGRKRQDSEILMRQNELLLAKIDELTQKMEGAADAKPS